MRADQLADDKVTIRKYCCVCGKVVKVTEELTARNSFVTICSIPCHQLIAFFQGLIYGHALYYLFRQCSKCINESSFTTCNPIDSFTVTDKVIKTEPDAPADSKRKYDTDTAANVLEELLQVTFDEDYDASQDSDKYTDNIDANTNNHSNTLQLPYSSHDESFQAGSVQVNAKHSMTKKYKIKLPNSKVLNEKSDSAFTIQDYDVQGALLVSSTTENGVTNSSKKKVTCDICKEQFIETHLNVHIKAKHTEKLAKKKNDLMFSCSECNKKFGKQSNLNRHLANKHPGCGKLTKSCTICHKDFSNQLGLSVHMRHAHKTHSLKECDLCHRTFKRCKELNRHKLQDHKLRVHICHLCGKNFAYGHALKSHLDAHAGVKKHFCEVCGEGFVRMTSLCGHRISAHTKRDEVIHKCEICETQYTTKALLNKHLLEAHFTGPYAVKNYKKQKCATENQNCQRCRNAEHHSDKCSHSTNDTKQYICNHCGKNFSKAHYLKAHEKQHQEAKFSCDICCKRFTYKCNLKAHKSTHSSDKPFQCTVCSKTFRLKFLLDDHQRTHNRDLLFKCYVCHRGFTRIPNLKRHIRVMHPEVNHKEQAFNLCESN